MENYETGEFSIEEKKLPEDLYNAYINNQNSILLYQWGVYVTAAAANNLFKLGACVKDGCYWLYSDTDSCYSDGWDMDKLNAYNEWCKQEVLNSGYGPVLHNGKEYWLGVAEYDKCYTEFRYQGAKRYCGRDSEDGELHITVAGVPKKTGAKCLNDDIENFKPGLMFDGITTGKLTHQYIYPGEIYMDQNGNETGNSINLIPCDYLLDGTDIITLEGPDIREEHYNYYG